MTVVPLGTLTINDHRLWDEAVYVQSYTYIIRMCKIAEKASELIILHPFLRIFARGHLLSTCYLNRCLLPSW